MENRNRRRRVQPKEQTTDQTKKFEVREDDRLTINFAGAKISIGNYSSVDLDGAYYSRTLREGDDIEEQFNQIYDYLRDQCFKRARAKLAEYRGQAEGKPTNG